MSDQVEYAVRYDGHLMPQRTRIDAEERVTEWSPHMRDVHLVSRRVSEWEPVDKSEANDE